VILSQLEISTKLTTGILRLWGRKIGEVPLGRLPAGKEEESKEDVGRDSGHLQWGTAEKKENGGEEVKAHDSRKKEAGKGCLRGV